MLFSGDKVSIYELKRDQNDGLLIHRRLFQKTQWHSINFFYDPKDFFVNIISKKTGSMALIVSDAIIIKVFYLNWQSFNVGTIMGSSKEPIRSWFEPYLYGGEGTASGFSAVGSHRN